MSTSKKKNEAGIFERASATLIKAQTAARDIGIIEFVETIVDAFNTTLFLTQRVLLKSIYTEPLDEDTLYSLCGVVNGHGCKNQARGKCDVDHTVLKTEYQLMKEWVAAEKSNWVDPRVILAEHNMQRAIEGHEPQTLAEFDFRYQMITVQAGMRCVSGDTYVLVSGTGYKRMDELLPAAGATEVETAIDVPVQTRKGVHRAVRGLSRPAASTKKLVTRYGYSLEGSLVHPVLVMTSEGLRWKNAGDVVTGDYLCVERRPLPAAAYGPTHHFEYEGKPVDSHKLAYVLGALVGDGSCVDPCKLDLTSADLEISQPWRELCSHLGKETCVYEKISAGGVSSAKAYPVHSTKIRNWFLNSAGLGYCNSYTKTIPSWIMQGSREEIVQFLRGLFDTDGFATRDQTLVGIGLCSEELVRQIQLLLLGFGIISSRKFSVCNYVRRNGENSTTWKLEINGNDARQFGKLIGFSLPRKQKAVENYGDINLTHGSTVDTIPHLHARLRRIKDLEGHSAKGSGRSKRWAVIRKQCTNQTRRKNMAKAGGITYPILAKAIDYFKDIPGAEDDILFLESVAEQHLFYDEVVTVVDGQQPVYDICVPEVSEYVANGLVSHNSSKSASMGLIGAYEYFKLITADCPQDRFGLPRSSPLYITPVASTHNQALGTIFFYIEQYIKNSTFFKTLIDRGEIILREGEIEFPEKGIIIAAGHSKATNFVGRTAVLVLLDELAMFSADEGASSNADDVYNRIGRSTSTVKKEGKVIALSSVKCQGDFMETLVREDWPRQRDGCLVFNLSTFDVNPMLSKEDSKIKGEYAKDLVAAQRDYENIRPGAVGQFLIPAVISAASAGRDPQAVCKYAAMPLFRRLGEAASARGEILLAANEDPNSVREMSALQVSVEPINPLFQSYAHGDPGLKHDSFGFACAHPEVIEGLGIASVFDIVLEWMPRALGMNNFALVDLVNVEDVMLEICKRRKVCELTYDHWNSASSIQRMWREGIIASEIHFGAAIQELMYENFRIRMNAGLVKLPNHPVLIEELECLEVRNGKKVDHPKNRISRIPGHGKVGNDLVAAVIAVDWKIARLERDFVRGVSGPGMLQPGAGGGIIVLPAATPTTGTFSSGRWNQR